MLYGGIHSDTFNRLGNGSEQADRVESRYGQLIHILPARETRSYRKVVVSILLRVNKESPSEQQSVKAVQRRANGSTVPAPPLHPTASDPGCTAHHG